MTENEVSLIILQIIIYKMSKFFGQLKNSL